MTACPRCGSYGHDRCEDVPQLPTFQSLVCDSQRHATRDLWQARALEVLIVAIVAAAVLLVVLSPSAGASYNHISVCQSTLRGGSGSDDDVHVYGVATSAQSFGGWSTSSYYHDSAGDAHVKGLFNYWWGWQWAWGECWNGDYGPDSL